jgi:2-polyprenyl-3-methyl-5-hydroxy-6-metoxy-1,4-benzoquinol methylase
MKEHIKFINNYLSLNYSFFKDTLKKQTNLFGTLWEEHFNKELVTFYQNDFKKLQIALDGYCSFALEGMKLQVKFNKTREYEPKTYEDASLEVYQNENYMLDLYLPGIYLSHFLWKHHYEQQLFFQKVFLKKYVDFEKETLFYDIGIGTGFYSKEMLQNLPKSKGQGFDLSPYSIKHTKYMLEKFNLDHRYRLNKTDIIKNTPTEQCDYVICIEVLEHLENPQLFLNYLFKMLKKNGIGLISAAINAPNADHIYLYRNYIDVKLQIEKAGFIVKDFISDNAYQPRNSEDLVPVNAAFIVLKK